MTERQRPLPPGGEGTVVPKAPAIPERADDVRSATLRLAERFLPHEARGLDATFVVDITDLLAYTIRITDGECFVAPGADPDPDTTLRADASAWADLVSGRVDGVRAFTQQRLAVDGDLNLALRLETMFRPGPEATRVIRTTRTRVHGLEIESLVSGYGEPVLLLHGLGASKVSFLPAFDHLADRYEVHALDLPGFGKSSRPLPHGKRYSQRWMAEMVHGYMQRNHLREVWIVGNSMGGRIATEVALRHPRKVRGIVNLCAAVAFDEWTWAAPFLRVARGQWVGVTPVPVRREWVEAGVSDLFHDATTVPAHNIRAAAGEAMRDIRDRRYRLAVVACARWLATDRVNGRRSFWNRLKELEVPSYWIWGASDPLVSAKYSHRVRDALPKARNEIWQDMGHVPQFEDPDRTNAAIVGFFNRIAEGG